MRIMGIDGSLTGCGLVILYDGDLKVAETIVTDARNTRGQRLHQISKGVTYFWTRYGRPDFVAMEDYSYGSPFNREAMGEVGGVIKLALYGLGVEPMLWPNQSWKKAVLGKGGIKKEDLRLPIFKKFNVEIVSMDQLEAFCVAMAEHMAQANPSLRPVPKKKRGVKS